ncbi:GNAT family N-acetyltransferase [Candidatus Roizmanbacteria bacterium]|nr:GNAT family N-acetyltransferase [Candidatus Roizmanbacteria bacterium]
MKNTYRVRAMNRKDLDTAIKWAAKEGWNPGPYDAQSFYETDPNGYFMGFLGNEPVSCISAVSYNGKFGFLGFYITKPEHRGKGYGIQVWNKAVEYLENKNIGLDGVVAQQENYKKSGFKLAYNNIRYEGKGTSNIKHDSKNILEISTIPFEQLLKYDTQFFPAQRSQFLRLWVKQPKSLTIGFVEKNELRGYGMIRKCKRGYKIGPLFANNEKIAERLLNKLRAFISKSSPFYLDIPEVNENAVNLAQKYHLLPIFKTARMYTREPPTLDLKKIFGVTTFELG